MDRRILEMKHDHATEVNMLKSQMQSMECEMKTKMKDLECDHEQQMAQLKNDLTLGDVTLRSNVEELEASLEVTSNKVASMKAQHSSKVQQLIQEKKAERFMWNVKFMQSKWNPFKLDTTGRWRL